VEKKEVGRKLLLPAAAACCCCCLLLLHTSAMVDARLGEGALPVQQSLVNHIAVGFVLVCWAPWAVVVNFRLMMTAGKKRKWSHVKRIENHASRCSAVGNEVPRSSTNPVKQNQLFLCNVLGGDVCLMYRVPVAN
jgi:hypothetical protein